MEFRDLQETAGLAHLNMSEQELRGAFPAFEQMLGYFAAMQAADQDESAFTAGMSSGESGMAASARLVDAAFFRPDSAGVAALSGADSGETLLSKAGERDGRFVVIPNVL
jgi:aspartyl-tRNA(Asn)/glutamyl-tRNA(Gln) amidotransferase subunit C